MSRVCLFFMGSAISIRQREWRNLRNPWGNRIYVSECLCAHGILSSLYTVYCDDRDDQEGNTVLEMDTGWSCSSLCLPGRRHFLYSRSEAACSDQKIENYNCCHAGRRSTIVGFAANGLYSSYTKIKGVKRVINERKNTAGSCGAGGELMLVSGAEIYRVEDTMNHMLKRSEYEQTETIVYGTGIFVTLSDPNKEPLTVSSVLRPDAPVSTGSAW